MNDAYPLLNIGVRSPEVNSCFSSIGTSSIGTSTGGTSNPTFTGINPHTVSGINPHACVSNTTAWTTPKTAVEDFLKIQYAAVEVRCAITRKMIPAGSAIMLLGGMVISAEAFERWLEGHLSELIGVRHGDLHTDAGAYEE